MHQVYNFKLSLSLLLQAQNWLLHGGNPRCLDSNPGNKEVFVSVCDPTKDTQRWKFDKFDAERLEKWNQNAPDV